MMNDEVEDVYDYVNDDDCDDFYDFYDDRVRIG